MNATVAPVRAARANGVTSLTPLLGLLCVLAIWICASAYPGIEGDARIYVARALADNDPDGVGRDLMFTLDGQSGFTIFRFLAARLVAWLGPGGAAFAFALLNMVAWFVGLASLARCFTKGRTLALLVICAAVLPCTYGFYPLMGAREVVAVPRPLSEAFVLMAMAALLRERIAAALGLLAIAALLHPIMALPGLGALFIVQGLRDRRWFWALGLVIAAVLLAALAGVDPFARLLKVIDPAWRQIVEDRNPYLFVTHWQIGSFGPIIIQAVTLVFGALLTEGRQRLLFLIVLALAATGLLAALLLGDTLGLVLALQVQPWRCFWLAAALAMPAFGLCLVELPRRGQMAELALALLAFAWITFDRFPLSPLAALMALALVRIAPSPQPRFSRAFTPVATAVLLGLAVALKAQDFSDVAHAASPAEFAAFLWRSGLVGWLCIAAAFAVSRWPGARFEAPASLLALASLLSLAALTFDARSPAARQLDRDGHDPALAALLAGKPGEVLWLNGDELWYLAGRPQWNGFIQGAGNIFSRPLALAWHERVERLVVAGLADANQVRPWDVPARFTIPKLDPAAMARFCAAADAPTFIVSPAMPGTIAPPGASVWTPPSPRPVRTIEDGRLIWRSADTYVVIPCRF